MKAALRRLGATWSAAVEGHDDAAYLVVFAPDGTPVWVPRPERREGSPAKSSHAHDLARTDQDTAPGGGCGQIREAEWGQNDGSPRSAAKQDRGLRPHLDRTERRP